MATKTSSSYIRLRKGQLTRWLGNPHQTQDEFPDAQFHLWVEKMVGQNCWDEKIFCTMQYIQTILYTNMYNIYVNIYICTHTPTYITYTHAAYVTHCTCYYRTPRCWCPFRTSRWLSLQVFCRQDKTEEMQSTVQAWRVSPICSLQYYTYMCTEDNTYMYIISSHKYVLWGFWCVAFVCAAQIGDMCCSKSMANGQILTILGTCPEQCGRQWASIMSQCHCCGPHRIFSTCHIGVYRTCSNSWVCWRKNEIWHAQLGHHEIMVLSFWGMSWRPICSHGWHI